MVTMSDDVRTTLVDFINDSFVGQWANKNLRADVMLAKAKDTISNVKDGLASAGGSMMAFAKDPLGKGDPEPEVAMEKTPKLGRSGQILARQEEAGATTHDSQVVGVPQKETYASISGLDGLVRVNGTGAADKTPIVMDMQNYSVASISEIAPTQVTNNRQFMQQQEAGLGVA